MTSFAPVRSPSVPWMSTRIVSGTRSQSWPFAITAAVSVAPIPAAKDVILKVIGTTGDDAARYAAVEFTGPTVDAFPMNERFVLCNMTTEMGAKVGMIAADDVTKEYLAHSGHEFEPIRSDDDATFLRTFAFDVDGMGPQVACPSNPANLKPVEDVAGTKIDVAFLGSCTNARIED